MTAPRRVLTTVGLVLATLVALSVPGFLLQPTMVSVGGLTSPWDVLLSTSHNAYYVWRYDTLSHFVNSLIAAVLPHSFLPFHLLVLTAGSTLVIRQVSRWSYSPLLLWVLGALAALAVPASVGLDGFVIGSLSWIPLLAITLFALINASRHGHALRIAPVWCIALFLSVQSAVSANQSALCVALMALVLARFCLEKGTPSHALSTLQSSLIIAIALVPALWVTFTLPLPPLEALPEHAHLIPGSGESVPVFRLIGGLGYPVATLNERALLALLRPISLYLVPLVILVTILSYPTRSERWPYLVGILLVAALSVACGALSPDSIAPLTPVTTLVRFLPWGNVIPLASLILASVAWLTTVIAVTKIDIRLGVPIALATLCSIVLAPPELRSPPQLLEPAEATSELQTIARSPSAPVIRHVMEYDPLFFKHLHRYRTLSTRVMRPAGDIGASYFLTLGNSEVIKPAEGEKRLRTAVGGQVGGETLTIQLAEPSIINGIEISPGLHVSDFPRGLRIEGGACDKSSLREIVTIPSWQGAVQFTKLGHPFWADYADVRIIFPKPEFVECIFVEQTGRSRHDWSIASVSILKGRRDAHQNESHEP